MKNRLSVPLLCTIAFSGWSVLPGQQPPTGPAPVTKGAGDLMIVPTRIVLEGRTRAAEVMLKNAGTAPATYRILLQEMEMGPDGKLQERHKKEGELTAADIIRYSPRQVDLAPGEGQIVRIQVRKPENLPDGEYRSHMLCRAIPAAEPPPSTDAVSGKQELSITIKPIYGISIPIIVRSGETSASVSMSDFAFNPAPSAEYLPTFILQLHRTGNRSVMGDIEVAVESGGSIKKGSVLGLNKGVAVYNNLDKRQVVMPLTLEKSAKLAGTRLKVTFTPKDMKGAPVVSTFDVP